MNSFKYFGAASEAIGLSLAFLLLEAAEREVGAHTMVKRPRMWYQNLPVPSKWMSLCLKCLLMLSGFVRNHFLLIVGHEFMFAAERSRTEFSEGMVPLLPSFLFLSFPL